MKRRIDGRGSKELRALKITRGFIKSAEGSALIELGNTRVICTASVEGKVPPFLRGTGSGWITAEYGMIPRATETRTMRESVKGRISGRSHEIQRLIGRSLRSVADLNSLGERTIWIDCDVIQADGGTRTASITGAMVALAEAVSYLKKQKIITENIIHDLVAAISVGIVDKQLLLDLNYREDSAAQIDMNLIMTSAGKLVEIQATAESEPFTEAQMNKLVQLAKDGIKKIITVQKETLGNTLEKLKLKIPSKI